MIQERTSPKKSRKRVDARVTIGFDALTYEWLEAIADAKCAPLAQIVREAVVEYLASQPLSASIATRSERVE